MATDDQNSGNDDNNGDDEPPDSLIGTLIDRRYRVLSRVGDGGMGIVYQVEHTYLNKLFALKLMRPTRDSIERQRFEQEARLASKIHHKNVIEISDFGVLPTGQPYFVMELLRGHTLGDAIYEGRIDPLLACHIAAQIASGLQVVHKQHVVHRDLKPDNIFLVDPDDQDSADPKSTDTPDRGELHFVKIMDFGIAKSIDKNLTGTGMTLGTPEYMSPEQATGDKIDWRSDQYSLGCILYEMLTGELLFTGKGAFEIMQKHLSEPPIPPRKRRPDYAALIPVALEKIVLTMLAKKPAQRHASMRAVELGLREVVSAMQQSSQNSSQLQTVVSPPPPYPRTVISPPPEPATKLDNSPGSQVTPAPPPEDLAATKRRPPNMMSDVATRPLLQALPSPDRASNNAKTIVMGATPDRGYTPTPKLIDKLATRVKSTSVPDLGSAPLWQRIAPLRWLVGQVRRLWRRLFGQ